MKDSVDILTPSEAAECCKVTRQAIYIAMRSGALKCEKNNRRISIKRTDLEEYHRNRYSRQNLKINGKLVFNPEKGEFSVAQISIIIYQILGRVFSHNTIYYLLRKGAIKSLRKGCNWVIMKKDLLDFLEVELGNKEKIVS